MVGGAAPVLGPSPGIAAVLSFFWSGVGHLYCGRLARGFVFFGVAVLLALIWFSGIGAFAGGSATHSMGGVAGGQLFVGVVWLGWWMFAIIDAYNCASSPMAGESFRRRSRAPLSTGDRDAVAPIAKRRRRFFRR